MTSRRTPLTIAARDAVLGAMPPWRRTELACAFLNVRYISCPARVLVLYVLRQSELLSAQCSPGLAAIPGNRAPELGRFGDYARNLFPCGGAKRVSTPRLITCAHRGACTPDPGGWHKNGRHQVHTCPWRSVPTPCKVPSNEGHGFT